MADDLNNQARATNAEIRKEIAEDQRDAALNVAANESVNRDLAETEAVDARIEAKRANMAARELDTDRRVLGYELAGERQAAANNAFGFYLTLAVVIAALCLGAVYYWYWRPNSTQTVISAAPPPPPPTTVVTPPAATQPQTPAPPAAPAMPAAPAQPMNAPPPTVNVTPPPVRVNVTPPPVRIHNDIHVPPAPAPETTPAPNSDTGTTGPDTGTNGTGGPGTTDNGTSDSTGR